MFNQDRQAGSVASHFYSQQEPKLVEPISRPMMATNNVLQPDESLKRSTAKNFGANLNHNDPILNCALTALINRQLLAKQFELARQNEPVLKTQQASAQGHVFKERVETKYGTCTLTLDFRNVSRSPPLVTSPPMGVFKHPTAFNSSIFKSIPAERPTLNQEKPKVDLDATHNRLVEALVAQTSQVALNEPKQSARLSSDSSSDGSKSPINDLLGEAEDKANLKGRAKEMTIEKVIRKVSFWRQLWSGVIEDGVIKRYSLDEAARKTKISRKSLDDYLLQLRLGKKYGYDFKSNNGALIGNLRRFVRKQRALEKKAKSGAEP